jgi:polysaccharide deacetylase family protein (PEP-CTERM system associated)
MNNVLTVDVEEYFHPTEVQLYVKAPDWQAFPSRIERQVDRILTVFDAHRVSATFFILGWIAERHPHIVRAIAARGHEIGCHSYAHRMVSTLTPEEFREDTRRAVVAIEDACGITPRCYRAPSYSITSDCLWALEILIECGFSHDSSIYPIRHDRYGIPGFSRHATLLRTPSGPIFEIPIATVKLGGENVAPVGGGGYLRLLPYVYTAAGIRRVNDSESKPVCIYFHPWEIDPDQPRLPLGWLSRIRTYTGLRSMPSKIERLLKDFTFSSMSAVYPRPRPVKNSAVACGAYR